MRHYSRVFVSLLLVAALLLPYATALGTDDSASAGLSIELAKGKTATVSPEISEAHADEKPKTIEWSSSDETVATVSGGKITAKDVGTAEITCGMTFEDSTEDTVTWEVKVFIPISSIKTGKTLEVSVGDEPVSLAVEIAPDNATYKDLEWTSSDEEIVKVDQSGTVSAVKAGKAVLTASSNDPGIDKKVTATCSVTVRQPVLALGFEQTSAELAKGKSLTLTAEVTPEDATNKQLTWTSSDPAIAAVDSKGKVTAKGLGNATITCEAADGSGASASCDVEVFVPVGAVKSDVKAVTVNTEETTDPLTVTIDPEDAKYKEVTWTSADETIATVSEDGKITGVKAGKTKITATSNDVIGETEKAKFISLDVTVQQPVVTIRLDNSTASIAKGSSKKLAAEILPLDATNKKLVWKSSNESVATVSNGSVSAKGVGKVTITCEAADGSGISASCEVTVYQSVKSIKLLTSSDLSVTSGKTITVRAEAQPSDATTKKLRFESENTRIATVDDKGLITGKSTGTCMIYIYATDGSDVKSKVRVYVEPKISVEVARVYREGYFGIFDTLVVNLKNLNNRRAIKRIDMDVYLYNGSSLINAYSVWTEKKISGKSSLKQKWTLGYVNLLRTNSVVIRLTKITYTDGTVDNYPDEPVIF